MDNKKLAQLLYPNITKDISYYLEKYPSRVVLKDAYITRFAPSPTGYLHIGGLFQCMIHQMLTKNQSSVFYLRLEDTDAKREIINAGDLLYQMLIKFGMEPKEGYRGNLPEKGLYGPYKQSDRVEIYHAFAKHLVSIGRAYPCFCEKTADDSTEFAAEMKDGGENDNAETSVYDYDVCRKLSLQEIEDNLTFGKSFALRLKSIGNPEKSFKFYDLIKGERDLRENGKDIVLIKSNGVPVYSFAHVVDDTLMGSNIIVRGEDWLQSVASHIEIFEAFGLKPLPYLHSPNLCKLDDGKKRKLSKRKDPEADCRFFLSEGYPVISVKEYLLNLINSDFEDWRRQNPYTNYMEFPFSIEKMKTSNPMVDMQKLDDISKECIARLTSRQLLDNLLNWAKEYNTDFADKLSKNFDYSLRVISIDRDVEKPRKDIYKWSMVSDYYNYMFEDYKNLNIDFSKFEKIEPENIYKIMYNYISLFDYEISKEEWFAGVKVIAKNFNFCTDMKLYKKEPEIFVGNISDFCNMIRYLITGKTNTPDLYEICKTLGRNELSNRLKVLKQKINE